MALGVVSLQTLKGRGPLLVSYKDGTVLIGDVAQPVNGVPAQVGDVVKFRTRHYPSRPLHEEIPVVYVFDYEVIDPASVDVRVTSRQTEDGETRISVSTVVRFSHVDPRRGWNVYESDILGAVYDKNMFLANPIPEAEYVVCANYAFFNFPATRDGGWVILYVQYWPLQMLANPGFGFLFYDHSLQIHCVWNVDAEREEDRVVTVDHYVMSRFGVENCGNWVDVFTRLDDRTKAGRIELLSNQTPLKCSGNKVTDVTFALLNCEFTGKRKGAATKILQNKTVGEIVDVSNLYWREGDFRKMWCCIETEPRVHWIATEEEEVIQEVEVEEEQQGYVACTSMDSGVERDRESATRGRGQTTSRNTETTVPEPARPQSAYSSEYSALFADQLTVMSEEDPVPIGDLITKGDQLRILVRRLFSHKEVKEIASQVDDCTYKMILEKLSGI